jgi:hypothetical protein
MSSKDWCSPFLHKNSTNPHPLIHDMESSPKRTESCTASSRSTKATREPHMWFVASVSQIQDLVSRSSFSPSYTNTLSSCRCSGSFLHSMTLSDELIGPQIRPVAAALSPSPAAVEFGDDSIEAQIIISVSSSSWATLAASFLGLFLHSRPQWPNLKQCLH